MQNIFSGIFAEKRWFEKKRTLRVFWASATNMSGTNNPSDKHMHLVIVCWSFANEASTANCNGTSILFSGDERSSQAPDISARLVLSAR